MRLTPSELKPIGTVDPRFQSYNVEMVEVTGGRFWAPYAVMAAGGGLYHERAPVDLGNPRLRLLAAALGPAYVRVSGTWANSTYFCDADPATAEPPDGYGGVLAHRQWQGVIDFAEAVDAEITTSAAISAGTRDAAGRWQPEQVRRLFAATQAAGGRIAGIEFMNEPSAGVGAPPDYDAAAYARDFDRFATTVRQAAPQTLLLGPCALGDRKDDPNEPPLAARRLLEAAGAVPDVLSYHFYGAASRRCAGDGWWPQTRPQDALSEDWLGRTRQGFEVYRALRDRFLPGKAIWLTETADTVCGGNPWAATFLDSFRYLDQLGRLAQAGVQVVMHNTLCASDYGLIDEATWAPRPNYWCALLWRRLMGTTVFDCGDPRAGFHLYAHSLAEQPTGMALLAINTDREKTRDLTLPVASVRYTLSAEDLRSRSVMLNGAVLKLLPDGTLPAVAGAPAAPGTLHLPPESMTFLTIPG